MTGVMVPGAHAARRRTATGVAVLWAGTVAFGASTVALLAVLARHPDHDGFASLAALLSLAFVVSLVPAGVQLRSASLVADGRPPPTMTTAQTATTAALSLAVAPVLAVLLKVPLLAAALVTLQMVVAIPLASRQGALLARQRFGALGTNLCIEGGARLALGAAAGLALGVTGLAAGLCAGTAVALVVLPTGRRRTAQVDRPRTTLLDTSLALALLGLYVQFDVLIAPSVVGPGATTYDLAAVPSKGVYLVLLAAGPMLFPFVRRGGSRRLVVLASLLTLAVGVVGTAVLVVVRPLIHVVLGRPEAGALELGLLGLAMALAGVTGIVVNASVARGVRRPWPPLVLGLVTLLACWPAHPGPLAFAAVVLASQAVTAAASVVVCLFGARRPSMPERGPLAQVEAFAEAGDPLAPAQVAAGMAGGPAPERPAAHRHLGVGPVADPSPRDPDDPISAAVIVPTFRRPELLANLLASLAQGTRLPDEVLVVDNDPEWSVDPADLPPGVQLVRAGFGVNASAARNLGWRTSRSRLCIFVDDDNEVEPGFVEALVAALGTEQVGLAGPVIYSGDQGVVWCGGLRFSRWTGFTRCHLKGAVDLPEATTWPTDGLPDAYALPRAVLERVGGLDDTSFPLCGEEFDLAERVGALGLAKVVVRGARVRHYGNVSEDPGKMLVRATAHHGRDRARLMARSRVRVHRRHSHGPTRWSTLVVFVPVWAVLASLACLRVKAPVAVRLDAVRALGSGLLEGYREPFA